MPIFQYKAYDAAGEEITGTAEALSLREAKERLRKDGLYPRDISLSDNEAGFFTLRRRRVSLTALATATRQLSVLLSSGTTLYDALSILSAEGDNGVLGGALFHIKESISGGSSFAKALEARPGIFSEMYVRTVEAGELSGTLDAALLNLSGHLEARSRLHEKVKTALIYPALMIVVGALVILFLFIFVIPKITAVFEDTKQSLPLLTIVFLRTANIVRNYWYILLACAVASFLAARFFMKKPYGREAVDRAILRLPLMKGLIMKFYMATFARTMGDLLSSGVPLLNAMDMAKRVLNQAVFQKALDKAIKDVTEGASLSMSLKSSGVFSNILTHMIATGEKSGELDSLLLKAAASYEREFEQQVSRGIALLEPLLILVMGVVVGFFVLAILLPILQLNQVVR